MNRKRSTFGKFAALAAAMAALVLGLMIARTATANSSAAARAAAQDSGVISGKIFFKGTPPKRGVLDMSGDPVCAGEHSEPVLAPDGEVNSNGTVPNVFLYIESVPGNFHTPPPATLDQVGCMYEPHVLGVMVGQELLIVSKDPTTHNVHFMSKVNRAWNETQLPGAPPLVHKFSHPEIMILVHCNHHPWMRAFLGVSSNPFFAVTGDDGAFSIKGLPPGEYTLHAWTATFGAQEQKITVRPGETAEANFTFK
ncbi:MAG TPA: carboxypeptidase regulatory-like domain-containing protein [Candidatus Dormibacteraeota bacterium]|nr:carboxypeptidase regulatory-like domain-containing protein [Candidatus Dormibacteraeota bacterium]